MADGGAAQGRTYTYHYGQIGGKGTAQSSMGTAVAFDGEKSFADLLQAYAAGKISLNTLRGRVSDNSLKQYTEGELTKRQAAELATKVQLAEQEGALELAREALKK